MVALPGLDAGVTTALAFLREAPTYLALELLSGDQHSEIMSVAKHVRRKQQSLLQYAQVYGQSRSQVVVAASCGCCWQACVDWLGSHTVRVGPAWCSN